MIHDFDEVEEFLEIKINYENLKKIKNSLSDNRNKYRDLFHGNKLDLGLNDIERLIKDSEKALLIDCYTYSEKLLKYTIYHSVDFRKSKNEYINRFLELKIAPKRFSPVAKFESFQDDIKKLVKLEGYKFFMNKECLKIKKYDEMIDSRHSYAHDNKYPMDFNDYENCIDVLEYLTWECRKFIVNPKKHHRLNNEFFEIIKGVERLKKLNHNLPLRNIRQNNTKGINIKVFRNDIRKFLAKYRNELEKVSLFKEIIEELDKIQSLNLNKDDSKTLKNCCLNVFNAYKN